MDKLAVSAFLALTLTTLPLAGQQNPTDILPGDQVRLRVIHAVQGIPAVSVALGETKAFDNVAFKQITAWESFPVADNQPVKITLADGRELKTTEELDFDDDDEQYTILIAPDTAGPNPKVVVLEGDIADADAGEETEVTVINAAPEHKSLNLVENDDTLERGVNFGDSGDVDLKPGAHTLKIVDADKDTVISSQSVNFQAGQAVTLVVMGGGSVKVVDDVSPDKDLGSAGSSDSVTTGTKSAGSAVTTGTM